MEETKCIRVRQKWKILVIPAGYNLSRVQSEQCHCAGRLRKPSVCVLHGVISSFAISSKTKQSLYLLRIALKDM